MGGSAMPELPGGHDLVVGGNGMLAGLCRALAGAGRQVSVSALDDGRAVSIVGTVAP